MLRGIMAGMVLILSHGWAQADGEVRPEGRGNSVAVECAELISPFTRSACLEELSKEAEVSTKSD